MVTDRNLIVLTRAGTKFGIEFLKRLQQNSIKPYSIFVENTTVKKRIRMAKFLAKKIGYIDAIRYNFKFWMPLSIRFLSFGLLNKIPDYSVYSDKVVFCNDLNDKTIVNEIIKCNAPKVILAQSGIIRSEILKSDKLWVVNCHPGKLPEYRGVDVIKWALYEKKPVEVTLHKVDFGIDTGSILKSECIRVLPNDNWRSVEERAINKSLDILVEAAINGPEKNIDVIKQEGKKGKQYYLMPFKKIKALENEWPDIIKYYCSGYRENE